MATTTTALKNMSDKSVKVSRKAPAAAAENKSVKMSRKAPAAAAEHKSVKVAAPAENKTVADKSVEVVAPAENKTVADKSVEVAPAAVRIQSKAAPPAAISTKPQAPVLPQRKTLWDYLLEDVIPESSAQELTDTQANRDLLFEHVRELLTEIIRMDRKLPVIDGELVDQYVQKLMIDQNDGEHNIDRTQIASELARQQIIQYVKTEIELLVHNDDDELVTVLLHYPTLQHIYTEAWNIVKPDIMNQLIAPFLQRLEEEREASQNKNEVTPSPPPLPDDDDDDDMSLPPPLPEDDDDDDDMPSLSPPLSEDDTTDTSSSGDDYDDDDESSTVKRVKRDLFEFQPL